MSQPPRVTELIQRVTDWASRQADIQAVVLVGSYARNAATDTSDVDLVIVTRTPSEYLDPKKREWVDGFGRVQSQKLEHYGQLTSLRVQYDAGLEVEFGVTDEDWAKAPIAAETRAVLDQGMVVLFERGTTLEACRALGSG